MRLTLLGTQGWIPTGARETTCFAVEDGDRLLVFDAGTGLRRFIAPPWRSLVERCAEVHLFLTHYHLDHVCGLAYLQAAFPQRRVVVHAPDASVTGVDPEAALTGLIRAPYSPRHWRELPEVELHPLRDGVSEIAGHRVAIRAQTHSDVSVAYRLEDVLAVATDTAADPATATFAAGARVMLHEAWYLNTIPGPEMPVALRAGYAAHSEALAVARLAAEAEVSRLVLVHLNPLEDEASYATMAAAARELFAAAEVRADGDQIDLGDA